MGDEAELKKANVRRARSNKNRGTYHEKWFVEFLNKIKGITAERQPLSGALGGKYAGDIKLYIRGLGLVGEVKYRDKSNFPSPYKVLDGRDIAFYKRRTGQPQSLVIMTTETFKKIMENENGMVKDGRTE